MYNAHTQFHNNIIETHRSEYDLNMVKFFHSFVVFDISGKST